MSTKTNSDIFHISCRNCDSKIKVLKSTRIINDSEHFYLCSVCRKTVPLISKSKCLHSFLLDNDDVSELKSLYFPNLNNVKQFFLKSEIDSIIIRKYKNKRRLKEKQKKKMKHKHERSLRRIELIDNRRCDLVEEFKAHKLLFEEVGDSYSYIHYGKPCKDDVIKNVKRKQSEIYNRRNKLIKKMNKRELKINEDSIYFQRYIKDRGCSTDDILREIELENFLFDNTNFKKHLDTCDIDEARELALGSFVQSQENPKLPDILEPNMVVSFE